MDQILTDVNTEYAQYRLFICKKENKFVHVDILDAGFNGKCPSDSSELEEVEPKDAKCPRCGSGSLEIVEVKPLATSDSAAE
jgi:Zn finger protein HypA/HybF involved in hydrogenase expression